MIARNDTHLGVFAMVSVWSVRVRWFEGEAEAVGEHRKNFSRESRRHQPGQP